MTDDQKWIADRLTKELVRTAHINGWTLPDQWTAEVIHTFQRVLDEEQVGMAPIRDIEGTELRLVF